MEDDFMSSSPEESKSLTSPHDFLNESSSNSNCNNPIRGGGTGEAGNFSLKMFKTQQNSSPAIHKLKQLIQVETDELG